MVSYGTADIVQATVEKDNSRIITQNNFIMANDVNCDDPLRRKTPIL